MYDCQTLTPGQSQIPMLTYRQQRTLRLIDLETQLKLSTGPRGRIDLLSQILTIKMDLRHLALAQVQGKEIKAGRMIKKMSKPVP